MGKIFNLYVMAPGDPSVGIPSASWTIEEVFDPSVYAEEDQSAAREDIRAAFKDAFELIIDGGFGILFEDELPQEPEYEY